MNINLNFPVVGLDGKPLSEDTLARVLALELTRSTSSPSVLIQTWAEKLWSGETLDLTPGEVKGLTNLIENSQRLPVVVRATAIRYISTLT